MKVLIENFIEKIETGDADKALAAVDLIIEKLESMSDDDLRNEVLNPEILTTMHNSLIEHLAVSPRAMQLNRRFPNANTRAVMFARAMRNGIVRVMD